MKYSENQAEHIVKEFINHNDEVKNIKNTLQELFYEWVESNIDYTHNERSLTLSHYRAIQDLLSNLEEFDNNSKSK